MDAVEELAWRLCSGAQEDYVRDLSERMADMLERGVRNPDEYRVLASRSREAALAVWAEHEGEVTDGVRAAFMEAMADADDDLVGALQAAYPDAAGLTDRGNAELKQAARGMARIIARDNVSFADGQADTFNAAVAEAVTDYQMGDDYRTVMERAVRRMSSLGTVDYRSGTTSQLDVLVRRHIVTQAEQARARDTVERCQEYGHDLVMVDTHYGARPSHAVWQGRVYSLSGHDRRYPGLREATGYGTAGGLAGANCRHFMTPYVPGLSQIPDVTPGWEKKYGMSSDDYYKVTQRQRAMERRVRALKRTVAMGQERGLDMTDDRYRLGDAQARLREHCERYGLQRDYERERAYGVSQQPVPLGRGKTTRTWTEFIDADDTRTLIRSSGLSLEEGKRVIRHRLDDLNMSDLAFSHQTEAWQQSLVRGAVGLSRMREIESGKVKKRAVSAKLPVFALDYYGSCCRAAYRSISNRLDGGYPAFMHGSRKTVKLYGRRSSYKDLADVLAERSDYDGQEIWLFACDTGRNPSDGSECFAQRLADELGVTVHAPDDLVWVNPNGVVTIGGKENSNTGRFVEFKPRKKDSG